MATEQLVTVETLQAIADAFNRHDLNSIMEFFADDSVLETPRGPDPWGQRFIGKDAVRGGLAGRFIGIPDVHYGSDRHWVAGNMGSPSGHLPEQLHPATVLKSVDATTSHSGTGN